VDQVEFISGEEEPFIGAVLDPVEYFERAAERGDSVKDGGEVGLGYYPEKVATAKWGQEDGKANRTDSYVVLGECYEGVDEEGDSDGAGDREYGYRHCTEIDSTSL